MKHVVITGATGVVGRRALEHLLEREDISGVTALGRRVLEQQHPKLTSKRVDLHDVEALAREIPDGTDAAVCGLGTTLKQAGSQAAFRAVDLDAVVAFGRAAKQRGVKRFVLVSAIGASSKSSIFYSRTKGEAEDALAALGFEQLTFLHPSFIDDEGTRKDDRLGERIGLPLAKAVFSLVGQTNKYAPIKAVTLGRAAVALLLDETSERVRTIEGPALFRAGA